MHYLFKDLFFSMKLEDIGEKYRVPASYEVYVLKYICVSTGGDGVISEMI